MTIIPTETLYRKVGRRYIPVSEIIDRYDLKVPVGSSILIVSTGPGCHTYKYNVDPDRAAFLAAATLFRDAMVNAIQDAAKSSPSRSVRQYTKKERECIDRYRDEMAKLGSFLPDWWESASPWKIADAAVKAVEEKKYETDPKF